MKSRFTIGPVLICVLLAGLACGQIFSLRIENQTDTSRRRESSITGRLVTDSGQPISNAAIRVRKVGPQGGPGEVSRSTGTDQDGKFRADDLASGAYLVSAAAPGYVPATESVGREYYRPGESVTLRMTRGGVITGTVTNMEGEPLVAARVLAVRVRDGEGRPIRGILVSASSMSRQTDDRGVYRIFGLQSGSYLIQVGGGGPSYYQGSAYEGDAPTYHPSTTRDAAVEVIVHTGDEVAGIDVRYRGDRGHIISGSLSGAPGSGTARRGASVYLIRGSSGSIEATSYVTLRPSDGGFALYGVADGEYDLVARIDGGPDNIAAAARRVSVKGTDVTGIDLALAPMATIAGRVVLESLQESDRKGPCKERRALTSDEVVMAARRDETASAKNQFPPGILPPTEATPDRKGEFKIYSLLSGRYRIETVLPGEDWFVRSVTAPGSAASKQLTDIMTSGLAISSGQHVLDVTITITEGAAALRGKVVAASEGATVPPHLRVFLVPADAEAAEVVLGYAEAMVDNSSMFSFSNLPPGRYLVLARAMTEEEVIQRERQPLAWDATSRAKLRRDAQAANVIIDLGRCQRIVDFSLKYSGISGAKAPAQKAKP